MGIPYGTARLAALATVATLALVQPGAAQSTNLEGSWSGGGSVSLANGARENARCRAQYTRTSNTSYTLRAVCATTSGRASQTATLRHVGGGNYQGTFHNPEYNVSGTINVTVGRGRQTVHLTGDAGSAVFQLRR